MVLAALEAMGSPPAETLYVGDMTVDVETARAAGLAVAVVPEGSSTREELEALRPDYLLSRARRRPRALRFPAAGLAARPFRDSVSPDRSRGAEMAWSGQPTRWSAAGSQRRGEAPRGVKSAP